MLIVSRILEHIRSNKNAILIGILIIFYTVGSVGTQLAAHKNYFLGLSAFNLTLSFVIAVLAIDRISLRDALFFLCCYLTSMIAEWIGTSTGLLFGNYYYGENLGTTILGVPLVIGLNWWILIMGASSIVSSLKIKPLTAALIGALLMTVLDWIMEPVAIESDFWHWKNEQIPVYNYICWFALAFALLLLQQKLVKPQSNKVHSALFLIITLFFIIQLLF
jgi:putative membrane protein